MTARWQQTIHINEDMARALIETQGHLQVDSICLLDEGWDNLVYLVNQEIIFRFPRREFGLDCLENEMAILPFLASQVSFPLSAPFYSGQPSELYPYPFAGYRMIRGTPLCDASHELIDDKNFALKLAFWLKELHTVEVNKDYTALIKGEQNWRLDFEHRVIRCKENLSQYGSYFVSAGFSKQLLLAVIAKLPELKHTKIKQSWLHGDLYCRHIIVNPDNLSPSGLIDWGDVHVGHPGIDLAVGMIFTKEVFPLFLNAYEKMDDELLKISLFHSFCHSMSFLPYAFEQNKKSLKRWATIVLGRAIDEINSRL